MTLKKEVINCFWARTEMACGITIPLPLNHVILGEDGSLFKKHIFSAAPHYQIMD